MGLLENELQEAGHRTRHEVAMERCSVKTQALVSAGDE
jgi:hypothetical protein